MKRALAALALVLTTALVSCEGPAGPAGPPGTDGADGSDGETGSDGATGSQGSAGVSPWVVGDGVDITIESLDVSATGATVTFTLKDGSGHPLDRTGLLTEGTVAPSFVLAPHATQTDGTPAQYTADTKRNGQAATQ